MLENMLGVTFHLHLSCHLWSVCMDYQKLNIRRPHSSWNTNTGFLCYQRSQESPDWCLCWVFISWALFVPFNDWKVKYVQNSDNSFVRVTVLRFQHQGLNVEAEYCCSYFANSIILHLGWGFFNWKPSHDLEMLVWPTWLFLGILWLAKVGEVHNILEFVPRWSDRFSPGQVLLKHFTPLIFPSTLALFCPSLRVANMLVNWQSCMLIIFWGKPQKKLMIHYFTLFFCFNRNSKWQI